ncbi:hypothetical protein E5E91_14225 [Deinococcus radiodurans R1 = ATCC 13939 = DSM 20539]|uniref:Uncharacterized protein n=1 Tax=Deinococcus radiodurans (strain ATCC 13939 / DSM 20539 / JCM 16871 / CCUG 27074 / LMG 4051 / NBRC 15346 / NCIMB 9279 / VKM B-1422 / R1) TaxID=243230 RepID=Q9RZ47_DEIRA|nr:hypothetical protein DR_A0107 [Deinococcus radiodurans R1 = ATCC 13939 = DSM 20539]ANC72966.1 hypothetical protein A2G07_14020 [Deinococcus radiodurans R1 = ATCC 13939 = DSM 20539]QEM72923.1 hypothetical protein DXG80_14000 [Deinococcus radiodurans]UDL01884.1 hypothetical protein E5E91_14225 [Deinococcus radiodurans R1 = ATCC 13939 = DSM 20539]
MDVELSTVFYLRDRAMREYHFYKLPEEARKGLAEPPESPKNGRLTAEQQISRDALVAFMSDYNLPELQHRVPGAAARELLALHKAGKLPRWAQKAVRLREMRAAARG